jgi:putative two-component system response regulator
MADDRPALFDSTRVSLLPEPRLEDEPDFRERLGATILLVDDNAGVRTLVRKPLVAAGYDVLEAGDGDVALEILHSREVDLVILDVRMPGHDGIEVCTEIRRHWDSLKLPVIFVTGLMDRDVRVWCKAVGGDEFLTKPPDETELLVRVDNLLRLRRYHWRLVRHNQYLEDTVTARTEEIRVALHEMRRREAETAKAFYEAVRRLGAAAEYRHAGPPQQLDRVGHYAALIAREAGLDGVRCSEIRVAMVLHDVGNIGVPEGLLGRLGPLEAADWEAVRRHPDVGHWILAGARSSTLDLAATIAWTHHERWDGGGYPRGLKDEEIPLEGRIAAIADAFDAMSSDRPFRKGRPLDDAFEELQRCVKTQFDPRLVQHFGMAADEVRAIHERLPED